jgi:hypothetical protein
MSEPDAAPPHPAPDPSPDPAVERAVAAAAERLTRDIDAAVRREQAENLIQRHMLAAAALALVPVPRARRGRLRCGGLRMSSPMGGRNLLQPSPLFAATRSLLRTRVRTSA